MYRHLIAAQQSSRFAAIVAAALFFPLLFSPDIANADAKADLQSGLKQLAAGDLNAALPDLNSAAQNLPESVEAKLALGECLLKLGRTADALTQYRQVLKLSPQHTAANQIVAALTGEDNRESQLQGARLLMKAGDYRNAAAALGKVAGQPQSVAQRQELNLLLAEAELWAATGNNVAHATSLLNNGTPAQQQIARVIVALSLTGSQTKPGTGVDALLAGNKAPAPWDARAQFARQLLLLNQAEVPAAFSKDIATSIASIPSSEFRRKVERQIYQALVSQAALSNKKGDTAGVQAILWPVVSTQPLPADGARLVSAGDTWLSAPYYDDFAKKSTQQLLIAGAAASQNGRHAESLLSFFMAFAIADAAPATGFADTGKIQAIQGLATTLAIQKPAAVAALIEDTFLRMSLQLAGQATSSSSRQMAYELLLNHLKRQTGSTATQAALNKLVTRNAKAPTEVRLVAPLDKAPHDDAYQMFVIRLAQAWHATAKHQQAESSGLWRTPADAKLATADLTAILLLNKAATNKAATKLFHEILADYKSRSQWAAARTAIQQFHSNNPGQLTWALASLSLQQARAADAKISAGNQRLPADLPQPVTAALTRVEALLKEDASAANLKQATTLLNTLVQYYTAMSRKDLVQAVLKKMNPQGPLAAWIVWQQVEQLNLQANANLKAIAAKSTGKPEMAIAAAHAAEIKLLNTLLKKHASSDYARPAVQRVSAIVQTYLNYQAHGVAISILKEFTATHPALANLESLELQIVAVAVAAADHQFSQRDAGDQPPVELPEAYSAAMNEIASFLKKQPNGQGAQQAEKHMLSVLRTLGNAGAWPAARQALQLFVAAAEGYHPPQKLEMYKAATYLGELENSHGVALLTQTPKGRRLSTTTAIATAPGFSGAGQAGYGGGGFGVPVNPTNAPATRAPDDPFASNAPNSGVVTGGAARVGGAGPGAGASPGDGPAPPVSGNTYSPVAEPNQTALALIRRSQQQQFTQLALLDNKLEKEEHRRQQPSHLPSLPNGAVLSAAELKRQDQAADAAYALLLKLAQTPAEELRPLAASAREQVLWLFGFFEGQQRPGRAHELIVQYLADQPEDPARIALQFQAIQTQLSAAGQQTSGQRIDLNWLDQRDAEFEKARAAISAFAKKFKDHKDWTHKARLLAVASFETEAALASAISSVRAGGFLVNAAQELLELHQIRPSHPGVAGFPQRLYNIAERLYSTGQRERAIYVHSQVPVNFPVSELATSSVLRIAQLHAAGLANPLRAVETYQEYLSLTGKDDAVKSQIFSIAQQLSSSQRYLEALHVFGVFVDSFPTDARACQALQAIGQVHQSNEVWNEALSVYERVLDEYPGCAVIADVKLTMAECHINLSQWSKARRIYEEFPAQYPKHAQAATASSRLPVLKQLDRYQSLLADQAISRNKDDAQYQIARIVLSQLNNRIKAIEEFGKVVNDHPKSDLADDAQLEIGKALLALNRRDEAREALRLVAQIYTTSPSADDALYLIGQSYEQQALSLATVTQQIAWQSAFERNQRGAYAQFNSVLAKQTREQSARRAQLKSEGKSKELGLNEAADAFRYNGVNFDNISNSARNAEVLAQTESALQVANKQDRINDAYRAAVAAYLQVAADYPLGDKTDDSLLQIAQIYDTKLKDRASAMATYQRVVKFFPGTPVAEDAAWKVADFYAQEDKFAAAATAYREFIRNYPGSGRVADAQFALAEILEQLGKWVDAMDAYEVFRQKFSAHPKARLAADQINWIKAYRK